MNFGENYGNLIRKNKNICYKQSHHTSKNQLLLNETIANNSVLQKPLNRSVQLKLETIIGLSRSKRSFKPQR